MGAAVATIMVSAERVKEKEAVPEVPAAGPRLHRNIWAQPAPRFPTYDPVAQRARTRQELVKFENQNKVAAEIVPIGAGPDTFVLWERGCQELENIEGVKEGIVQQFAAIELKGIKSEDGIVLGQIRRLIVETSHRLRLLRDSTESAGNLIHHGTLHPTAGMGLLQQANMMLDQLTYVDAAIAEAESFAANMGANFDHHCMHHHATDEIDADIANIMANLEKRGQPKKLMDPNWADLKYIDRLSKRAHRTTDGILNINNTVNERRALSFADNRGEIYKLDCQLSRFEEHAHSGTRFSPTKH